MRFDQDERNIYMDNHEKIVKVKDYGTENRLRNDLPFPLTHIERMKLFHYNIKQSKCLCQVSRPLK